jgi:hypothetical protein
VNLHDAAGSREWTCDRQSPRGRLDKTLDEAEATGSTVAHMKSDWRTIFPFGNK